MNPPRRSGMEPQIGAHLRRFIFGTSLMLVPSSLGINLREWALICGFKPLAGSSVEIATASVVRRAEGAEGNGPRRGESAGSDLQYQYSCPGVPMRRIWIPRTAVIRGPDRVPS